jgi:hypothetical protein
MDVVTHGLLHAAAIQLHCRFVKVNPPSREVCLLAAKSIIQWSEVPLADTRLSYVNPIMSVSVYLLFICNSTNAFDLQMIWRTACQVFIDEVSYIKSGFPPLELSTGRSSSCEGGTIITMDMLMGALEKGVAAMTKFSSSCPVMRMFYLQFLHHKTDFDYRVPISQSSGSICRDVSAVR